MQYSYNLHAKPYKIILGFQFQYFKCNFWAILIILRRDYLSVDIKTDNEVTKIKNKINIYFIICPISKLKWCLPPPPLCTLFWTLCTCVRIKTSDYGFGYSQTNDVQQRRLRVFNQSGLLNLFYYDVFYWTIGLHL